jgi:hypothetical protein
MKTKGQGRTGREEERCLRSTLAVFLLAQNLGREKKKEEERKQSYSKKI